MRKLLKLPRLNKREAQLLRLVANRGDDLFPVSVEEMALWTGPKMSQRLRSGVTSAESDAMYAELEALVARHLLDKDTQAEYSLNAYGAWSQLVWDYHYHGTLIGTAKKFFGIEHPKLLPNAVILYEVTEEVLGQFWDITDDDEAAYQEYLEELKRKNDADH
jgi:hypothetical protein